MKYRRAKYMAQLQASQRQSIDLVTQSIAKRSSITRSQMEEPDESTVGERAADAVATFGGSWTFIIVFGLVLAAWVGTNSFLLAKNGHKAFDPYPYILLNLFLSMLASVQAPLILMSQNRQSTIDRENVQNDYEVNLKAELEIMALHEKVDALAEQHKEQLRLLQQLTATTASA
ncbi:DUF1003 domain-containing protein [Massilia sp. RP-1-19]|uniref:DUF1003 domain-containing protein n=1 Tax=Massilia polaris TaxID=2728846 RepID=A0A848HHA8_9BURK|nr:DUF1003 domain-containing protein [Massilia polaris]